MNHFSHLVILLLLFPTLACRSPKTLSNGGFQPIFDGKTLNGWKGDSVYWRVENGVMVGEVTPQTLLKRNSFLIWTGGRPGDFELRVEYRISARGNSGINYRSEEIDTLSFALKGYQADIDGKDKYGLGYPRYTGQNYEERGRQFLALRGQRVIVETDGKPRVIDTLSNKEALLKSINYDDWNGLNIVAKGNHIQTCLPPTYMAGMHRWLTTW